MSSVYASLQQQAKCLASVLLQSPHAKFVFPPRILATVNWSPPNRMLWHQTLQYYNYEWVEGSGLCLFSWEQALSRFSKRN